MKVYTFIGCCDGIETIMPLDKARYAFIDIRCRMNTQRNYYWGNFETDEETYEGLKQLMSSNHSRIEILKLITKGPYMLPESSVKSFRRNILRAIKLAELKREVETEINNELEEEEL